jgi:hypothetical protein
MLGSVQGALGQQTCSGSPNASRNTARWCTGNDATRHEGRHRLRRGRLMQSRRRTALRRGSAALRSSCQRRHRRWPAAEGPEPPRLAPAGPVPHEARARSPPPEARMSGTGTSTRSRVPHSPHSKVIQWSRTAPVAVSSKVLRMPLEPFCGRLGEARANGCRVTGAVLGHRRPRLPGRRVSFQRCQAAVTDVVTDDGRYCRATSCALTICMLGLTSTVTWWSAPCWALSP